MKQHANLYVTIVCHIALIKCSMGLITDTLSTGILETIIMGKRYIVYG